MAVNVLKNTDLVEVSIVNIPSNGMAKITSYDKKSREVTGVASVEEVDTYNTIIDTRSMGTSRANLMFYNHGSETYPIGKITDINKANYNGKRALLFTGYLVKGDRDSDRVANLLGQNIVNGVSIGFNLGRKAEVKEISDEDSDTYGNV